MPGILKPPMLHGRFRMSRARAVFCLAEGLRRQDLGRRQRQFPAQRHGDTLVRDYIDHPGAVAILPMNDAGDVLLLRQYRHPVGMDLWEIPAGPARRRGGGLRRRRRPRAGRGSGPRGGPLERAGRLLQLPGSSSEAIRIYLARGLSEVPGHERHIRTDEEAEIELHWTPLDEAVQAVLDGRLHNPSAVVGVLAAAAARADNFESLRPAHAPWPAHPSQRR